MRQITAVQRVQTKVVLMICRLLHMRVSDGKPAFSYSPPYSRYSSQEWGTCHIKKQRQSAASTGEKSIPPPLIHPMAGGAAPVNAPEITKKALIFLRYM